MPLASQSRIVRNILTAEILALQEVIKVAIFVKCISIETLKFDIQNQTLPMKYIIDSKSLHDALYSGNN